jgi:hypothetical protein
LACSVLNILTAIKEPRERVVAGRENCQALPNPFRNAFRDFVAVIFRLPLLYTDERHIDCFGLNSE